MSHPRRTLRPHSMLTRGALGADTTVVGATWLVLAAVAWLLPDEVFVDAGWHVVAALAALAGVGLWWQAGRVRRDAGRALLFDGSLRYPIGVAATLPALVFLALLPLHTPLVASRPQAVPVVAVLSALALVVGLHQSLELARLVPWVARRSRRHLKRMSRIEAMASAVELGLARLDVRDDAQARSLAWTTRERHDAPGDEAHVLLRAGGVRIQIFEHVVQLVSRAERLQLDRELAIVSSLPHGVRLQLEAPDRYLLQLRGPRTPASLTALGEASAQLAAALAEQASPQRAAHDSLEGCEPPAPLHAALTVYGAGVSYTLDASTLTQSRHAERAVVAPGVDLARPYRLLLGRASTGDRHQIAVTVRQRDACADADCAGGLALEAPGGEARWREVRFACDVVELPTALSAALPTQHVASEEVVDGPAFQALWRALYWRSRAHGESVRSLSTLRFCTSSAGESRMRAVSVPRRRRGTVAAVVRTAVTASLAAFLLAQLAARVSDTTLQFPAWEPAAVLEIAGLAAGIVALGLVTLLGLGRRRLDELVADGLRGGLQVLVAVDSAITSRAITMLVPDTDASVTAITRGGRRVDGVLRVDGPVWGRLSVWSSGRRLGIPVLSEQLEIHIDATSSHGARLAADAATLQMQLLDAGVPAVLTRAGSHVTLMLRITRRLGERLATWSRVAARIAVLVDGVERPVERVAQLARPLWPTPPMRFAPPTVAREIGAAGLGLAALAAGALFVGALPAIDVDAFPVARVQAPDPALARVCPQATGTRIERLTSVRCLANAAGYDGRLRDARPQDVLPLPRNVWEPAGGHLISPDMKRSDRTRWDQFLAAADGRQHKPFGAAMADHGLPGWSDYQRELDLRVRASLRPPTYFQEPVRAARVEADDASEPRSARTVGSSFVTASQHTFLRLAPDRHGDDSLFVSAGPVGQDVEPGSAMAVCLEADDPAVRAHCLCGTLGAALPVAREVAALRARWPDAPAEIVAERDRVGVVSCNVDGHCAAIRTDHGAPLYCVMDPFEQLTRSTGRFRRH